MKINAKRSKNYIKFWYSEGMDEKKTGSSGGIFIDTHLHLSTWNTKKLNIGLHVQLKAITGKRVACHGYSLTKMFTVYVIPQKIYCAYKRN